MNNLLHLEESLQRDIELVKRKVKDMGDRTVSALKSSIDALVQRNRRLSYLVILRDQHIDELETELDKLCLEFLVRHQPAGAHLRFIYAAIQINKDIERIGDYAESIAKQVPALNGLELGACMGRFVELGNLATQMVSGAIQAFLKEDAALAWRMMELEEKTNSLRNQINTEVTECVKNGTLPTTALNPLLTGARRLERASDQAKNICEDVLYLCTGEFVKHKNSDGFHILFVDYHNSDLSQMAEAIGTSLNFPRFTFASAGIEPQPIPEDVTTLLASRGLQVTALKSKKLTDLPNWESSQVVIVLDPKVRDHLRDLSGKAIILDWRVDGLASKTGPARTEALARAYNFLESNIRDLAGAILESPTVST